MWRQRLSVLITKKKLDISSLVVSVKFMSFFIFIFKFWRKKVAGSSAFN